MPWKVDLGSLQWYQDDALWAFSADEGMVLGGGSISFTGWTHVGPYSSVNPLEGTTKSFYHKTTSAAERAISFYYSSGRIFINRAVKTAFYQNDFTLSYWINVLNPSVTFRNNVMNDGDLVQPMQIAFPSGNVRTFHRFRSFNTDGPGSPTNPGTTNHDASNFPSNQWVQVKIKYQQSTNTYSFSANGVSLGSFVKTAPFINEVPTSEAFYFTQSVEDTNPEEVLIDQVQLVPRLF